MRGAQRLFLVVESLSTRPMTLTEVARSAGLPKTTALRLLRTLEDSGWAARDKAGGYSLGPAFATLVAQYLSGNPLVAAATQPMRALHAEIGETVSLSRRVGLTRVCIHEFPSTENLRLVLGPGEQGPLHAGASGLILFAYMPAEERRRLTEQGLERYTSRTITDPDGLEAEAEKIREQGWALTRGQRTPGGLAVAVPIVEPGPRGDIAALGIYGPEIRASTKRAQDRWRDHLMTTAEEINRATKAGATPGAALDDQEEQR